VGDDGPLKVTAFSFGGRPGEIAGEMIEDVTKEENGTVDHPVNVPAHDAPEESGEDDIA